MQPIDRVPKTAGSAFVEGTITYGDKGKTHARTQGSAFWPAVLLAAPIASVVAFVSAAQSAELKQPSLGVVACVTLETAAAFGYLDDAGYRRVVRSLTSETNPNRDEFPTTYRAFMDACAALRAEHDPKRLAESARGAQTE